MNFKNTSPRLVHEYLELTCDRLPDKTLCVYKTERLSYYEVELYSNKLGAFLIDIGVKRHDRVIIFLDNSSYSAISIFGILKAGAAFVPLNPTIKHQKLNYILRDSGAKVIITQSDKLEVINSAAADLSGVKVVSVDQCNLHFENFENFFVWEDSVEELPGVSNGDLNKRKNQIIDVDLGALIYTSGSTGEAKGVMSAHYNIVSAASSIIRYLQNTQNDILLNVLPLSFDYGLYQVIMNVMFGGTIVIENSFLFPIKILEIIENEQITGFPIVPTILALFLNLKELDAYGLNSLRYISNTGAALPEEHIKRFASYFPHINIYSMFGLTECKRISYLEPDKVLIKPKSVGKAMPNCEVFIVDENKKELGANEIGELVVRGSNVMRGYWNSPELTAKVYKTGKTERDRLLFTGDLFTKDEEGYLYFVGRIDDMIKTKGERVSPKEVENILCGIDGVLEAAVIGIDDEILGKAIKAYIVKTNDSEITYREIIKYCKKNMETFMVPKEIEIVEKLPRTINGKVDKKILVEQY